MEVAWEKRDQAVKACGVIEPTVQCEYALTAVGAPTFPGEFSPRKLDLDFLQSVHVIESAIMIHGTKCGKDLLTNAVRDNTLRHTGEQKCHDIFPFSR